MKFKTVAIFIHGGHSNQEKSVIFRQFASTAGCVQKFTLLLEQEIKFVLNPEKFFLTEWILNKGKRISLVNRNLKQMRTKSQTTALWSDKTLEISCFGLGLGLNLSLQVHTLLC